MSEEKKLGIPKQSEYTAEELSAIILENQLSRGTYVIDVGGSGQYKVARFAKQWIQKQ